MRRLAGLCALWLGLLAGSAAAADPDVDALVERAMAARLHETPAWRALLHYRGRGEETRSEVVSPHFFLAEHGRRDPEAELRATLRAFFRPAEAAVGPRDEHPRCRFIARFGWLDERLGRERSRLPVDSCPRYREWRQAIDPGGVSLVFAAAYLNNPSSMFGHTFLRIDPRDRDDAGELTAYAVNFSAQTEETNGVLFAVKGLTGRYPGRYALRPYYGMVNDYAEIESRDLWSYPLDLQPAEIERMLRHLWEMEEVSFRYFFLRENCSYQILSLLETARPGLGLTGGFFHQVEPHATVQRLAEAGLLGTPEFRPALLTRIRERLAALSPAGRARVAALVAGRPENPDPPLAAAEHARVLETAFELLKYRQSEGAISAAVYGERALPLLRRRSRLPPASASASQVPPPDTAPHRAHGATRLSLGAGADAGGGFVEIGFRPSFHGITERGAGFSPGAGIEVLDLALRLPEGGEDIDLEALTVVDILSVARRGPLIRPSSWRFRGGYRDVWLDSDDDQGTIALEGGIGPAWGLTGSLTGYAFAQAQLLGHPDLPKGASIGAGARIGLLWSASARWSLHAWAEAHDHPARLERTLVEAAIEQTYAPSPRWAVHLRLAGHGRRSDTSAAGVLGLRYYY